jgi:hypothetical protein
MTGHFEQPLANRKVLSIVVGDQYAAHQKCIPPPQISTSAVT